MKAFWLKSSLVGILLLFVAAVGALPTRSDSGPKLKSSDKRQTPKRGATATAPLSYRSPGARHKLVIANDDLELQQQLQTARAIRKTRKLNAYSVVEISSETLDQLAPQALQRAQLRDDLNLVLLRRGQIDTSGPAPVVADDLRQTANAARALHLVQLFGPPTPEALAAVKATGARIVAYVPNNAYLVWGSPAQINRMAALRQRGDIVQWDGPYHPAYKIDPHIKLDSIAQTGASITVLDTTDAPATIARIKSVARQVLMPEFKTNGKVNIKVLTESLNLKPLAQLPDVIGIEPWAKPHLLDERANQIVAGTLTTDTVNNLLVSHPTAPGYLAFLNSLGFTSDFDFAIDFADTGFDIGSNDPTKMHADFTNAAGQSRVAYLFDYVGDTHSSPTHDTQGHGTINASIAAGFNNKTGSAFQDAGGYAYGLGVAPFARLGISKIFDDNGGGDSSRFTYGDLISSAYRSGARISSNSWGFPCDTNQDCNIYTTDCQIYDGLVRDADSLQDGNQGMVILFSSGNDGGFGDPSVTVPATAKNIIAVGASENYRPTDSDGKPSVDRCSDGAADGDNAQDVASFSSFGPVQDGRAKPDILAPGTFVVGAATQDTAYQGDGVCAVPGSLYYPMGQKLYTLSTGTSHSAPQAAGAAALGFQWLRGQLGHDPSPALVKALMLNSTSYLTGTLANDDLPGAHQGWGLLDIRRMFEQTNRVLYDESVDRTFTESGGQPFEISGVISDPTKEFRVMLAYTDAPGENLSSAPAVNLLNLEVVVDGVVYQANNFTGQYSQPGTQLDSRNNTQGVRLPAGTTRPFTIRVKPTVIAGDGVPNFGGTLDQDFALVVSNGLETPVPVLVVDNSGDVSAGVSIKHANGTTDASLIPGEQAAITLTVANKSATAAAEITNASLTLTVDGQTIIGGVSGGAISTIPPGSSPNIGPFNLQIPAALRCGAVAQLQLTMETSISTFKLPVRIQAGQAAGAASALLDDDVDSGRVKWKMKKGFETVNNIAHSGTMSYHVVDPGKEDADTRQALLFTKKSFAIPNTVGRVRLSFYHIFNFEPGYDGGVMEISTNDGETWEDLGSRMLVGGYDGKVTEASNNPLGTRAAWTLRGIPGVFSQVIINLDDFVGKRVKLRFMAGFDEATGILDGYQGWFIDDIRITAIPFACSAAAATEQPAEASFRRTWLSQPGSRPNRARVE